MQSWFAQFLVGSCSGWCHPNNSQAQSMSFSLNSMCCVCLVPTRMLNLWQFETDAGSPYLSIGIEQKKICCSGMPVSYIGCSILYNLINASVTRELDFIKGHEQRNWQLVGNGGNRNWRTGIKKWLEDIFIWCFIFFAIFELFFTSCQYEVTSMLFPGLCCLSACNHSH